MPPDTDRIRCVVPMCTSNCGGGGSASGGGETSFFPFPSHEKLRMMWMWSILKPNHSLVCSRHFDESDLVSTANEGLKLKENAFPLFNLPQPTSRPATENAQHLHRAAEAELTTASSQLIDLTAGPSDNESDAIDEPPESNERTREPAEDTRPGVQSETSTSGRSREVQDCGGEQGDGNLGNRVVASQLGSQSMLTFSLEKVNAAAQKELEDVHASIDMDHPYAQGKETKFKCGLCCLTFTSKDAAASHVCVCSANDQLAIESLKDAPSKGDPSAVMPIGGLSKVVELKSTMLFQPSNSVLLPCVVPVNSEVDPELLENFTGDNCNRCGNLVKGIVAQKCHFQHHKKIMMANACKTCGKTYINKESLESHEKVHLRNPSASSSPRVARRRKLAPEWKASFTGDTCNICNKVIANMRWKRWHYIIHKGIKPYQCDKCGKGFIVKARLKRHKDNHLRESFANSSSRVARKSVPEWKTNNFTGDRCNICGKDVSDRWQIYHYHNHKGIKPYKCEKCGKGFVVERRMKCHLEGHEGRPPCDGSRPATASPVKVDWHAIIANLPARTVAPNQVPKEKKILECEFCGRTYPCKSLMDHHMMSHTGGKTFKCDVCNNGYRYKHSLQRHKRTCVKEGEIPLGILKPYACKKCGKTFARNYAFENHLLTHRPTQERPYVCEICSKAFIYKANFDAHRYIHTGEKPHLCDVCGESFRLRFTLKQHYMRHTGEKPYRCEICDKRFRLGTNLAVHRRMHSGEKPFECDTCGKKFGTGSSLRVHKKTHKLANVEFTCNSCGRSFSRKAAFVKHKCAAEEGTAVEETTDHELVESNSSS